MATIRPLKSDPDFMDRNPWSALPFKGKIEMPLFDLMSGKYTGEVAQLDSKIFNVPLRKDVVHNVAHYFKMKGKRTYKLAKSVGDVAGTGKKPAP